MYMWVVAPAYYIVLIRMKTFLPLSKKKEELALAIPAGLGLNYLISPNPLIGVDIGHRFTITDYLDGYTSQYSSTTTFTTS